MAGSWRRAHRPHPSEGVSYREVGFGARRGGSGQVGGFYGEAAEAFVGGGEDGVADGGGHYGEAGLADAGGVFLAGDEVDLDFGHLVDAGHVVIVEIGLLDAAAVDGDGVFHHGGESVDGGAFHLGDNTGGIYRAAAINGVDDAMD